MFVVLRFKMFVLVIFSYMLTTYEKALADSNRLGPFVWVWNGRPHWESIFEYAAITATQTAAQMDVGV